MKSNLWIICTNKDYPLVYNCKNLIGACWPFFVCLFVCIHNLWCIFTIEYIQQLKRINEWYMQWHGCISKIFFFYVKEARHKNYVLYASIFMDSRTNKTAQWWQNSENGYLRGWEEYWKGAWEVFLRLWNVLYLDKTH